MQPGAIFISFDAVAVSGITVEALKVAKRLRRNDIACYLDVGYDIKVDKGNFNKPYEEENDIYQGCLLYTSPSPRDQRGSRMPSSA